MRIKHSFLPFAVLFSCLCFLALNSCKSSSATDGKETASLEQTDRPPGPPPGNRAGPPPGNRPPGGRPGGGGSPEQTKTLEEIGGYLIGDVATDFSLKNVNGEMVSLSGMGNAKGYIVTFTCNECPFAKMYEDRLAALHQEWAPKGYPVIAVNANGGAGVESYEAMQTRSKDKGFPFVYLIDEDQTVFPQYGAVRTPHVFVLDEKRTVRYIGAIDDNARDASGVKTKYVEDVLEALNTGKEPKITYTKAIGCPIKHSR